MDWTSLGRRMKYGMGRRMSRMAKNVHQHHVHQKRFRLRMQFLRVCGCFFLVMGISLLLSFSSSLP